MSYTKAEDILPIEIIELIQQYVDGQSIYIPRKPNKRVQWGTRTKTKQELCTRNLQIYKDYLDGMNISDLAGNYYLSEKSIQRIIKNVKEMMG